MNAGVGPMRSVRHWPGVIAAALTATVTVMPGFTVGALAPTIQTDLHIPRTGVGLAMSAFYAATALGSPIAKRLAARLPAPTVLAAAAVSASAVMVVLSQAGHLAALTATLVVGGLTNSLVQPAAGRLIAAGSPQHRRSLAAGLVGAALAAATLVPGLLVALVVQPYGWRTAMFLAGLVALAPITLAPLARIRQAPQPPAPCHLRSHVRASDPNRVTHVLVLWALAAALSAAANNAVASYFVQLAAHSGVATAPAGRLLSCSAVSAIAVRLATGVLTDRTPQHNPLVIAAMMLTGGAGLALIATGSPRTFVLGAILTFSAGWGWTGLLLATTLQLVPHQAEDAGHAVQTGLYSGATIAPFGFSALAAVTGFAGAALIAGLAGGLAATLMLTGNARLPKASHNPGPNTHER
jgi:predicted MFS family arabinose efflux permease